MWRSFHFFSLVSAVVLLACLPQCKQAPRVLPRQEKASVQEARLSDVPIPFEVAPRYRTCLHDRDLEVEFVARNGWPELMAFYEPEMERHGWQLIANHRGIKESLMVFDKPQRYCVISLRKSGNSSLCVITAGYKGEGFS